MNRKAAVRLEPEEQESLQSNFEDFCRASASRIDELYNLCCFGSLEAPNQVDSSFVAQHLNDWKKNLNKKHKKRRVESNKDGETHPFLLVQQAQFYQQLQGLLHSNAFVTVAADVILMLDFGIYYCSLILEQGTQMEEALRKVLEIYLAVFSRVCLLLSQEEDFFSRYYEFIFCIITDAAETVWTIEKSDNILTELIKCTVSICLKMLSKRSFSKSSSQYTTVKKDLNKILSSTFSKIDADYSKDTLYAIFLSILALIDAHGLEFFSEWLKQLSQPKQTENMFLFCEILLNQLEETNKTSKILQHFLYLVTLSPKMILYFAHDIFEYAQSNRRSWCEILESFLPFFMEDEKYSGVIIRLIVEKLRDKDYLIRKRVIGMIQRNRGLVPIELRLTVVDSLYDSIFDSSKIVRSSALGCLVEMICSWDDLFAEASNLSQIQDLVYKVLEDFDYFGCPANFSEDSAAMLLKIIPIITCNKLEFDASVIFSLLKTQSSLGFTFASKLIIEYLKLSDNLMRQFLELVNIVEDSTLWSHLVLFCIKSQNSQLWIQICHELAKIGEDVIESKENWDMLQLVFQSLFFLSDLDSEIRVSCDTLIRTFFTLDEPEARNSTKYATKLVTSIYSSDTLTDSLTDLFQQFCLGKIDEYLMDECPCETFELLLLVNKNRFSIYAALSQYENYLEMNCSSALETLNNTKITNLILVGTEIIKKFVPTWIHEASKKWKEARVDVQEVEDYMKDTVNRQNEKTFQDKFITEIVSEGFFSRYIDLFKKCLSDRYIIENHQEVVRCALIGTGQFIQYSTLLSGEFLPLILNLLKTHRDNGVLINSVFLIGDIIVKQGKEELVGTLVQFCNDKNQFFQLRKSTFLLFGNLLVGRHIKLEDHLHHVALQLLDSELQHFALVILRKVFGTMQQNSPIMLLSIIVSLCKIEDMELDIICQIVEKLTVSVNSFVKTSTLLVTCLSESIANEEVTLFVVLCSTLQYLESNDSSCAILLEALRKSTKIFEQIDSNESIEYCLKSVKDFCKRTKSSGKNKQDNTSAKCIHFIESLESELLEKPSKKRKMDQSHASSSAKIAGEKELEQRILQYSIQ